MNIVLLANKDRYAAKLLHDFLMGQGNDVSRYSSKPENINFNNYDLGVSWYYPHILREEHIEGTEYGVINCHPSFLPFNRGAHTNVWSIVDDNPAGVTIHWIEKGIDTGNILERKRVEVSPLDTGFSLYNTLEFELFGLFIAFWPSFQKDLEGGIIREGLTQDKFTESSHHFVKELDELRDIESYMPKHQLKTIKRFIDIARATTYSGYKGCFVRDEDGNKIYIDMNLYMDE